METSVEPLDGNKVKLHVAVPAGEFEQAIDAAFRKLAHEVRIPGFRPGKAPRRILEARFGTEVAREQALKDALPEYYADAVLSEDLDTIATPEIDITAGEDDGDVEFEAVVEVRPEVTITGYDALRVELELETATDEAVDDEVGRLRERFADLEESSEPLVDGDYAVVDIAGSIDGEPVEGLTATDFLYEIGSAIVTPGLDGALGGKSPGDIVEFDDTLPERFGERAGDEVSFRVLVKETKHKVLPELADEWIAEVTEFETVDGFTADIRTRMDLVGKVRAQVALRDKVLDELASLVPVEAPEPLVRDEMQRRLHDLAHRLEAQGATIPQYLEATGQPQEEFVEGIRQGAVRAVLADLALRAVVSAEGIEATDDELAVQIERLAERTGEKPKALRRDLERRGVIEAVRSEIARGKALELVVDHAEVVDAHGTILDLTLPEPDQTEPNEAPADRSAADGIEPTDDRTTAEPAAEEEQPA